MGIETGVAAAHTAIVAGESIYKGWGWFKKWRYGKVVITHPHNRAVVQPEWVDVAGTHRGAKGHYWLIMARGDGGEYWPSRRINLLQDGEWREKVNVGSASAPKTSVVLLVWVSDFMHSILEVIIDRNTRAKYWGAVKMNPPKKHFSIVQSVVLNVVP